jgi:hypothetical protein
MSLQEIVEIRRVARIEELVIGRDTYRIEVLRCTQPTALEPAFQRETFTACAYRRMDIEVRPAGQPSAAPVAASVWVRFPLQEVLDDALEDRVLEMTRSALVEEIGRRGA